MNENAVHTLQSFLKLSHVKVTKSSIQDYLINHPEYPSMLSYSDALNEWNIEHIATKLNSEQLSELPTLFIAHLDLNGGIFAVVRKLQEGVIEWLDTKNGWTKEKISDFAKKWSGYVMVAEPDSASGEKDYSQKRSSELIKTLRIPLVLTIFSVCACFLFYLGYERINFSWQELGLLLTKFCGIIATSLLLWQTLDKNNGITEKLCQINKKVNCQSILDSKAAKITSWLSWSEVGFFYFTGSFLTLLLTQAIFPELINESIKVTLSVLTILCLPYTVWSIFYQWQVAKLWCPLCLSVMGVIWVDFFLTITELSAFISSFNRFEFSFHALLLLITGFLMPVGIWILFKASVVQTKNSESLSKKLLKLRNNPKIFEVLTRQQKQMLPISPDINPLIIGNLQAPHTLTIITNPLCSPCSKKHHEIEDLLKKTDRLKCQIIFASSNKDGDERGIVARKIISLPVEKQREVLNNWYERNDKNVKKWVVQNNLGSEEHFSFKIIDTHNEWIKRAEITSTPTVFFNGFELGGGYQISDLKTVINY